MTAPAPKSFEDIALTLTDRTVLLDVDGTLLPDGDDTLGASAIIAAKQLAERNTVYLLTNGKDRARINQISSVLGIAVAPSGVPAGKPRVRAVTGIVPGDRPFVVVGDKYLIDGLLARNLKAEFIPTSRKRSGSERTTVRLSYMIDRVVSWLL